MSPQLPIVLVTGFTPFGGEAINPSQQIARTVDGEIVAGHRIVGAILPTEFAASLPELERLIASKQPKVVLALGLAGGRAGISLERVAINLIDARIPDNAGNQPIDVAVVDNAPNAYFSTLPIKAMLSRLLENGIEASISHTAGTYVCNQVFYALAHLTATNYPSIRSGFIHVPYLPEQANPQSGKPGMPLESMVEAVRLCIAAAVECSEDPHYAAGEIH
ncbi:MAG: pyroglutamyl-peptidase I [Rudaea sp.]